MKVFVDKFYTLSSEGEANSNIFMAVGYSFAPLSRSYV